MVTLNLDACVCSSLSVHYAFVLPWLPHIPGPPAWSLLGSIQRTRIYRSSTNVDMHPHTHTGQRGGRPMSGRMRTGQVTAGPSREAAYGVALAQEVKVTDRPVTQQVLTKVVTQRVVYFHSSVGTGSFKTDTSTPSARSCLTFGRLRMGVLSCSACVLQ